MSDKDSAGELPVNITADFTEILNASPKGAKYVFNILFGKKHAEAERRIRLSNAQDYADMKKIVDGNAIYNPEKNTIIENSPSELKSLIISTIQEEEIANLISCTKSAASNIDDSNNNKNEPTKDFINRWRNEAKLINDTTIQYVWGRILSEEVNAPNSISLRTLDVIKNLSKKEADYFTEIMDFVFFEDKLIDSGSTEKPFYPQEKALALRDAGLLVSFTPGMYRSGKWPTQSFQLGKDTIPKVFYITSNDKYYFIDSHKTSEEPTVCIWELTSAAKDLYNILKKEHKTQEESVKILTDWIIQSTKATEFYYGDVEINNNGNRTVNNLKTISRN